MEEIGKVTGDRGCFFKIIQNPMIDYVGCCPDPAAQSIPTISKQRLQ